MRLDQPENTGAARRELSVPTITVPAMALGFQLVVDCAQPHVLADWWAETLGWEVEGTDEGFIRKMVEQGFATDEDTVVHRGELKWKVGAAINHPDGKDSGHPRVLFQLVPEG